MAEPEYGEALAFSAPTWRSFMLLAVLALTLFAGFSLFANFDRVANVRGVVVPASGISRLVAPQPGVITAVLVRQGMRVEEGAPLFRIASTNVLPTGAAAPEQVVETFRRQQRIAVEANAAERRRSDAERRRAARETAEFAAARHFLQAQIALQRDRIASNEQRLADLAPLRVKGYVSELTYQEQEEAVLSLRQQLAALEQREAEARHNLEAAEMRQAELAADAQRAELERSGALLALERGAAGAQARSEITVTAPLSGTISALRATPGMAVALSEQLLTIIPGRGEMEVLLFVPPRSAGFLRPGQPVVLRYDAFPHQRHGTGRGIVMEVSATAAPERLTGNDPSYRVKVRLTDSRFPLRPDMTLSASIVLERRSLAEWLFAPLRESWREGVERRKP